MTDVVFWALVVLVILAVQATERPSQAAPAAAPGPGWPGQPSPLLGVGAATVARFVIVAAAGLMVVVGLFSMLAAGQPASPGVDRNNELVSGALQAAGGLCCLGLFFFPGSERIPGFRRLRPRAPVSWLAILLFFESLASNLAPSTAESGVTTTVQQTSQPTAESLMLGAVPFLVIGAAAVGPYVRRNLREAAERLGLWPLRLPWWVVGIAVGLVCIPAGDWVAGWLTHLTSAQCLQQQVQVQHAIAGTARTTLEQIGVAAAAGVCEETLFRGALQPRVGILLSSALWASYHLQYTCNGLPSASNLYILLLGFVFGALRKWGGLWPAILAHTVYDGVILLNLF